MNKSEDQLVSTDSSSEPKKIQCIPGEEKKIQCIPSKKLTNSIEFYDSNLNQLRELHFFLENINWEYVWQFQEITVESLEKITDEKARADLFNKIQMHSRKITNFIEKLDQMDKHYLKLVREIKQFPGSVIGEPKVLPKPHEFLKLVKYDWLNEIGRINFLTISDDNFESLCVNREYCFHVVVHLCNLRVELINCVRYSQPILDHCFDLITGFFIESQEVIDEGFKRKREEYEMKKSKRICIEQLVA